jgi:hypothetical protein
MNIDWIIAIGLFIIFVAWSFAFYLGFFSLTPDMMGGVEGISNKVVGFLDIDVYDNPVVYDSVSNISAVMYADFSWPNYAKNSTKVFSDNQSLPCRMSGSRIYWQADLDAGKNRFDIRYHTENVTLECDSSFSIVNATQTIPWVSRNSKAVSNSKINQMLATDFKTFSARLGISQDFRVEVDKNGITTPYGKLPPLGYDVYVKETQGLTEDREQVKIRVMTW